MISGLVRWVRANAGPLTLAVLLHVVVGALLVLSTGFNAANPHDMPGPGSQHEPIQAVVVKNSDYEAAQASIKKAQQARQEQVERLRHQAATAQRQRQRAEHELAQLRQKKQAEATEATQQQKKLQQQQQQLHQLSDQAKQVAEQRKHVQAQLAELKKQAAAAEKARAAEAARLKKIQDQTEQAKKAAAAARKAQLQQQMDAEQQQQMSKARGNWVAAIQQKVMQSWIKPPDTPVGLDCFIKITQLPSGQVVGAQMQKCNGNQAVQQSIITAIYKASPLPTPGDPDVFQRVIVFEFVPDQSS